jgi:hypothetical protein
VYVNGSFHDAATYIVAPLFVGEDADDRGNLGDCLALVIRFSSRSPLTDRTQLRKVLMVRLIQLNSTAMTKGNIIPLMLSPRRNRGALQARFSTALTGKTGQTDYSVICFSSVPASGCYQQNSPLPATNQPERD